MNEERTRQFDVKATVVGYDDGVFNLELERSETTEAIEIDDYQTEVLCDLFGVEVPSPDPSGPEQWG